MFLHLQLRLSAFYASVRIRVFANMSNFILRVCLCQLWHLEMDVPFWGEFSVMIHNSLLED